ncbi:hypothetical protein HKD37_09G024831 [Glycine soja]
MQSPHCVDSFGCFYLLQVYVESRMDVQNLDIEDEGKNDSFGTIHNVPYADDVVRVSVVEVIFGDAEVPIPTSEIKFVKEALGSFVPWPTHLVKPILPEEAEKDVSSPLKTVEEEKAAEVIDPLGVLVKNLFDIYQRPVEVSWDGAKFGINNVKDGFFITHADYLYLFKAHWQLVVLCPGDNVVVWFCSLKKKPDAAIKGAVNSAMKSVTKTAEGKPPQHGPQWIEAKSHVQTGNYKCGYYVMQWIWCIVSGGLKDDWIHNTFISTTVLLRDRSSINTVSYDGHPQQNTVVVIGPFYDVCCYFYDGGVPMPVVVCCYFYDEAVDSRV